MPTTAPDQKKLATGALEAFDSQINTTTGTLRLRAVFNNDDESLFPNQFVNRAAVSRYASRRHTCCLTARFSGMTQWRALFTSLQSNQTVAAEADQRPNNRRQRVRSARSATRSSCRGGQFQSVKRWRERYPFDSTGGAAQLRSRLAGEVNPSRPFILRPVATSLLMFAVLLSGAIAYKQLGYLSAAGGGLSDDQVVTFYPGASPDVAASAITAPLERQFGQMPGLNQMTSVSSDGSSIITLQFALNLNIDVAEQEVQAAINASADFPATSICRRRRSTASRIRLMRR